MNYGLCSTLPFNKVMVNTKRFVKLSLLHFKSMFPFRVVVFTVISITTYSDCTEENEFENFTNIFSPETSPDDLSTAQCVLKLSAKYFVEKRALSGSIVIININSYSSKMQKILLQTIHSGIKYSVMVKDSFYPHKNASHFPEKAKNYMLILEEKDELVRNINQLNKLPTWNPHAKAIIFYQLKENDCEKSVVLDIINELRLYKLFKSIVFINTPETSKVIAYTWKPYSETNCGGICDSVYILDVCQNDKITMIAKQAEMFPLDMKGCPLVVYSVISEPYVMPPKYKLTNVSYNDAYEFDLGIEINLMKIIAQFTNMSLVIRTSPKPDDWGVIHIDGTASGTYEILRNDSADLIIGNMQVDKVIRKWFDPTNTYVQDDLTWCVPKAGLASTWSSLFIIFQWTTWLATFVSLIIMSIIFHYFYCKQNNGNISLWPTKSFLMTQSMLLGWGAQFEPRSLTFRVLVATWLIFSVNIGINYASFLRGFLIHPRYENQVSNEYELIESGLALGGRESYKSFFESNDDNLRHIYNKYQYKLFSEGIKQVALKRNFGIVSSRRQAEYQDSTLGKGAKLIYCFSERQMLYRYGVVLIARKWFPMLTRLNTIIRSVSENGLIWKWNNELFIHSSNKMEASDVVPLSTQHLLGAFLLTGVLYIICVLVFLGEIIAYRFGRRKIERRK